MHDMRNIRNKDNVLNNFGNLKRWLLTLYKEIQKHGTHISQLMYFVKDNFTSQSK